MPRGRASNRAPLPPIDPNKRPFTPTPEQDFIFATTQYRLSTGERSVVVIQGVAGCGKTETIIQDAIRHLSGTHKPSLCFMAFGSNAANIMDMRLRQANIDVGPYHQQMGLRSVAVTTSVYGKSLINAYIRESTGLFPTIDKDKSYNLMHTHMGLKGKLIGLVDRGFKIATNDLLFDPVGKVTTAELEADIDHFKDLMEFHEINDELDELKVSDKDYITYVRHLIAFSIRDLRTISFQDMVAAPSYLDLVPAVEADIVIVDEVQDANKAEEYIRLVAGKLLVAVGDPNQAIYAFRGSGTNSIDRIFSVGAALDWPVDRCDLTFNWRCPVLHIELARLFVPRIQPRPDAPVGQVEVWDMFDILDDIAENTHQQRAILSRTNAALFRYVFHLLSRRIKFFRRASSEGLEKTIYNIMVELDQVVSTSTRSIIDERLIVLKRLKQDRVDKATADYKKSQLVNQLSGSDSEKSSKRLGNAYRRYQHRLTAIDDMIQCCSYIVEAAGYGSVVQAFRSISPQNEEPGCAIAATLHKFKGDEADRIYLIDTENLGSDVFANDYTQFENVIPIIGHPPLGYAQHAPRYADTEGNELPLLTSPAESQEANLLYVALTRSRNLLVFEDATPKCLQLAASFGHPARPPWADNPSQLDEESFGDSSDLPF